MEEKTVLVIDDQVFTQKILAIQLNKCGLKHIQAMSGQEGIEKAKGFLPKLITLDYMMPDINGLEVLKTLKSDPKTESIPIIMLSGMDNPEFKENVLKCGAVLYINKPIVGNHLVNMIKFVLILKEIPNYDEDKLNEYLNEAIVKKIGIDFETTTAILIKSLKNNYKECLIKLLIIIVEYKFFNLKNQVLYIIKNHGSKIVREKAIWALGSLGDKFIEGIKSNDDAELLFSIAENSNENIELRILCCLSLKKLGYTGYVETLLEKLNDQYTDSF